jgi:anti-repressor protein
MNNLVTISEKGNPVTTSLLVAEKFGKRHADVLRAIKELGCSQVFHERNFALMVEMKELPQGGAAKSHYYVMTFNGFSFLVMGFTGKDADVFKEDYIAAFTETEALMRNDDYILYRAQNILKGKVQSLQETLTAAKQLIEEQKPKVKFAECVTASDDSILIGELARIIKQNGYNIGQNRLFEWLRDNGYLCKRGENYNQPTQKSLNLGLMEIKKTAINQPEGETIIGTTTKITGKGQLYFVNKFMDKKAA